jgi:hypothetical protein
MRKNVRNGFVPANLAEAGLLFGWNLRRGWQPQTVWIEVGFVEWDRKTAIETVVFQFLTILVPSGKNGGESSFRGEAEQSARPSWEVGVVAGWEGQLHSGLPRVKFRAVDQSKAFDVCLR